LYILTCFRIFGRNNELAHRQPIKRMLQNLWNFGRILGKVERVRRSRKGFCHFCEYRFLSAYKNDSASHAINATGTM